MAASVLFSVNRLLSSQHWGAGLDSFVALDLWLLGAIGMVVREQDVVAGLGSSLA